jgi:tetratricopeptide (TPR) repeat protein
MEGAASDPADAQSTQTEAVRSESVREVDARAIDPHVNGTEASEVEVSEAEVSEAEVSEAEVSEAEVSEAEVSEPEVFEADAKPARTQDAQAGQVPGGEVIEQPADGDGAAAPGERNAEPRPAIRKPVTPGARMQIFNTSPAQDCYRAAARGRGPASVGIDACTLAIEGQVLSVSDLAATYSNRGVLKVRAGNLEAALADHDVAVRLAPGNAGVLINRSNAFVIGKRYEEAFSNLEQAIDISDEYLPIAYYNRALLFQRVGAIEAARADAERAAELAPEADAYRAFRDSFGQPETAAPENKKPPAGG